MPLYMFQGRYSGEAIGAMVNNPQDREAAARTMIEAIGGKLLSFYFCFGRDDVVAIIDAPDDKSMAAGSMIIGASGAFSGGKSTKLMTAKDAMESMKKAGAARAKYKPPAE